MNFLKLGFLKAFIKAQFQKTHINYMSFFKLGFLKAL